MTLNDIGNQEEAPEVGASLEDFLSIDGTYLEISYEAISSTTKVLERNIPLIFHQQVKRRILRMPHFGMKALGVMRLMPLLYKRILGDGTIALVFKSKKEGSWRCSRRARWDV